MKIKIDYITNSSSCAFVFLGFELEKTEENFEKLISLFKDLYNNKITNKIKKQLKDHTIESKYRFLELYDNIEKFVINRKDIQIISNTDDGATNEITMLIGYILHKVDEEDYYVKPLISNSDDFNRMLDRLNFIINYLQKNKRINIYGGMRQC